jgi:hypothetical protein
MSDEPKRRAWVRWALLALVVLYPLSMGPLYRLAIALDAPWLLILYTPFDWKMPDPLDDIMKWYLRLWGVHV